MWDKGIRYLTWRGRAAIKRHSQRLPAYRVLTLIVRHTRREYLGYWRPHVGLVFRAARPSGSRETINVWEHEWEIDPVGFKRRAIDPATLQLPDLPSFTKTLAKFPTFVAFLTSRSYEDGGARLPGKFWFDCSSSGFALTLIDVDQALRLVVRAGTIDDTLAAAELVLGADNAPWEVDAFQAERQASKKKKK